MSVLKVTKRFKLGKKRERFVVEVEDGKFEWASRNVAALILEGAGLVSSGAVQLAARHEIPLAVLRNGEITVLETSTDKDASPLIGQVRGHLEERKRLALKFLQASLRNKMWLLRLLKPKAEDAAGAAEAILRMLEEKMGGLKSHVEAWKTEEKAREVVNRLLFEDLGVPVHLVEYARMHVVAEATLNLLAEGLEPTIGFLHPDSETPSLSRDLALEFIHQTADVAAIQAPEASRRSTLKTLERIMDEKFTHPRLGVETTYRKAMKSQAKSLAAYFAGKAPGYQPYEERK